MSDHSSEMSAVVAIHSKSRSGCITCKTRRVKCDEGKPYCVSCSAAGYHCAGYFESKVNESTDIRKLKTSKQFHAKSRFGCFTCKKRRVKCDEDTPACLRCISGGHECGGYEDLQEKKRKSIASFSSVILLPQREGAHPTSHSHTLFRPLPSTGSIEDQRSFGFFRSRTIHVLTGYYDHDFWRKSLLQISSCEPAVRHAVLAVGALHEQYDTDKSDSSLTNRCLALSHYNTATRLLMNQDKRQKLSIATITITCVLFACIELLLDHVSGAVAHVRSGVKIIRDWQFNNNRLQRRLTGSDNLIQNYLAPLFDHLNLNSFVFDRTMRVDREDINSQEYTRFETLYEARCGLYKLRNSIVYFRPTSGLLGFETSPALQRERFLNAVLEKWTSTFQSLLTRSIDTTNSSFGEGARLLQMQYELVALFSRHILFVPDMELDKLTEIFIQMLDYCELILEIEASNAPPEFSGTFSLQLRSVWPVFRIALDCRNPKVRRRAVSLLKQQPRRKGYWNSDLVTEILETVIEIEEQGLEGLTDCTGTAVPSAWARLANIIIDVDSMRESQLVVVSFVHKAVGDGDAWVEQRRFSSL